MSHEHQYLGREAKKGAKRMTVLRALGRRLRAALRWRRAPRRRPALSIDKSVSDNFLVCLDTGTRHVALRRHLKEVLGLTPAEYRRRWGLPEDYPMVARNYLKQRNKWINRRDAEPAGGLRRYEE